MQKKTMFLVLGFAALLTAGLVAHMASAMMMSDGGGGAGGGGIGSGGGGCPLSSGHCSESTISVPLSCSIYVPPNSNTSAVCTQTDTGSPETVPNNGQSVGAPCHASVGNSFNTATTYVSSISLSSVSYDDYGLAGVVNGGQWDFHNKNDCHVRSDNCNHSGSGSCSDNGSMQPNQDSSFDVTTAFGAANLQAINAAGSVTVWVEGHNTYMLNGDTNAFGVVGGAGANFSITEVQCDDGYILANMPSDGSAVNDSVTACVSKVPQTGTLIVTSNLVNPPVPISFVLTQPSPLSPVSEVTSGNAPFTLSSAPVGTYSVVATSPSGYTEATSDVLFANVPLNGTITISLNFKPVQNPSLPPSCVSDADAGGDSVPVNTAVTFTGSGGTTPYTWSDNTHGTTDVVTPTASGTISNVLTDANSKATSCPAIAVSTPKVHCFLDVNTHSCPKVPPASASLTANTSKVITVSPGDSVNYHWESQNGIAFNSSYTVSPSDACGNIAGKTYGWEANTADGSKTDVVASCQAGSTYVISYNAQGGGGSSTSTVVVIVTNPVTPPSVVPPTGGGSASLSINGSKFAPGDSWTLSLTSSGENSKPFALCATTPSNPSPNCLAVGWGSTDGSGNWSLKGTFDSTQLGDWSEWMKFGDGVTTNHVGFNVSSGGSNPPPDGCADSSSGGSTDPNCNVSKSGVNNGCAWTCTDFVLSLASTTACENSTLKDFPSSFVCGTPPIVGYDLTANANGCYSCQARYDNDACIEPSYDCSSLSSCAAAAAAANASNSSCGGNKNNGVCTPGDSQSCTSAANSCGMTGSGTKTCNSDGSAWGSCMASTPSDSSCNPIIDTFGVSGLSGGSSRIPVGSSATLSWNAENSDSCNVQDMTNGSVNKTFSGSSGSITVKPSQTTLYLLTCSNANGSMATTTTVTVVAPGYQEVAP
jgi:hypothetical protein